MSEQFSLLLKPLEVGPMTVRNRLLITAHATQFANPNPEWGEPGLAGTRYAHYLAERAKGGAGLIIYGQVAVHPTTAYEFFNSPIAYDEQAISGFKEATELIHQHGCKVFVQLYHSGANNMGDISKLPVWAPSNIPNTFFAEIPKSMEPEDIEELLDYYELSAKHAIEGGFDGIEIHSTHGYLLQQFLSPLHNKRTDEYGGSLENCARLLIRVVERISTVINEDMALGVRLCGDELTRNGLTLDETTQVAKMLEDTAKIHYVSVSVGHFSSSPHMVAPSMYQNEGYGVYAAAGIKKAVSKIPVFTVGRIKQPEYAEEILRKGNADMVGMTRAFLADPELGVKIAAGRVDEIRRCAGCTQECLGHMMTSAPIGCVQNPLAGKEWKYQHTTLQVAAEKKNIMVIGGGPAGMETAWLAAARGHSVTLYEQHEGLGGQVNIMSMLSGLDEIQDVITWRRGQLEKHCVEVVLKTHITPEMVAENQPDAVVVATGSNPLRNGVSSLTTEPIPGSENKSVVTVHDILLGKAEAGENVVIFETEGRIKGLAIAELLADQGSKVKIVTTLPFVGFRLDVSILTLAYQRVLSRGVEFITSALLNEILDKTVVISSLYAFPPQRRKINADTVVLITGGKANEELYFALKGKVKELYRIGDCVAPRTIDRAIHDGYQVGIKL